MEQPHFLPPPKKFEVPFRAKNFVLVLLPAVSGGGLLGFLVGKFGDSFLLSLKHHGMVGLALLLSLIPLWYLSIALHEFGHLLCGWSLGGRFMLFQVGPFALKQTPSGLRFSFHPSLLLQGGLAACPPLDDKQLSPGRMRRVVLGGPLASLLQCLAGFLLVLLFRYPPLCDSAIGLYLHHLGALGGGLGLLLFLLSALPYTLGGFKSDGLRFWDLGRRGPKAEQEAALLLLSQARLQGKRPRDWDEQTLGRALMLRDGSLFDLYACHAAYWHAADKEQWEKARTHLERLLAGEENLSPLLVQQSRAEYAWLMLKLGGDLVQARAWLDSTKLQRLGPVPQLKASAALFLAEGKPVEAAAKAREALDALQKTTLALAPDLPQREALEQILAQAEGA